MVFNQDDGTPPFGVDIRSRSGGVQDQTESRDVGIIIGVLLTVIVVLITGITYVMLKSRIQKKSSSPSFLNRKFQLIDPASGTSSHLYNPYAATTSTNKLYGHPGSNVSPPTQETIYDEPLHSHKQQLYASTGFLSLNRRQHSDPMLSEDCATAEEDYAEPVTPENTNNIYAKVKERVALKPLPLSHYARPKTPTAHIGLHPRSPPISAQVSPPKYSRLNPPLDQMSPGLTVTPSSAFTSPEPNQRGRQDETCGIASFYASVDICSPETIDLNQFYNGNLRNPSRSTSIDTVAVKLIELDRRRLQVIRKLGEGQFGEIHICKILQGADGNANEEDDDLTQSNLVAVKSLKMDANDTER